MYKGTSKSLQRKHRVTEIRPDVSTYVCEDDLIQSAANMGERECEEERRQLLTEKARLDNELIGAKASRDKRRVQAIGYRLQNISGRLGLLRGRIQEIRRVDQYQALNDAVKKILPKDVQRKVFDCQQALLSQATELMKGEG